LRSLKRTSLAEYIGMRFWAYGVIDTSDSVETVLEKIKRHLEEMEESGIELSKLDKKILKALKEA